MAKKKFQDNLPQIKCIDCGYSYDYYNISFATNKQILCKCKVTSFDHLLEYDWYCPLFKKKDIK